MNANKICCIIDLDGFYICGKFVTRELGWIDYTSGRKGSIRFDLGIYLLSMPWIEQDCNETIFKILTEPTKPNLAEATKLNIEEPPKSNLNKPTEPNAVIPTSEQTKPNMDERTNSNLYEPMFPFVFLEKKIREIHADCRNGTRDVVAFKGSKPLKDLLNSLSIPCLNLEDLGCPKYDDIRDYFGIISYSNRHGKVPSPLAEVSAFRQYIRHRYS